MTYTKKFYRLSSRCDLSMMKEQAAKYISDIKYTIQERVILHDVFSVDEAHNKSLRSRDYKVDLHLLGVQHRLKS